MNLVLQTILIISSTLFFAIVFNMVRIKRLELRYALTWILTGLGFIILSIFPSVLRFVSWVLHIQEATNTVFLLIIFFLLLTVFTLTLTLSQNANKVKTMVQEIGILKQKIETLEKQIYKGI